MKPLLLSEPKFSSKETERDEQKIFQKKEGKGKNIE